jgi:hypothetical protein
VPCWHGTHSRLGRLGRLAPLDVERLGEERAGALVASVVVVTRPGGRDRSADPATSRSE